MLDHGVFMEGSTLKPNMVNPGRGCKSKFTAKEIGEATVTALRRVMPAAMPGVNFLSGGQTLEDAAARLCAINQVSVFFVVALKLFELGSKLCLLLHVEVVGEVVWFTCLF